MLINNLPTQQILDALGDTTSVTEQREIDEITTRRLLVELEQINRTLKSILLAFQLAYSSDLGQQPDN